MEVISDNDVRHVREFDAEDIEQTTNMLYAMYQERYAAQCAGYSRFEEEVDKCSRRGAIYLVPGKAFAIIMPHADRLLSRSLESHVIYQFYVAPEYRNTPLAYRFLSWLLDRYGDESLEIIGVTSVESESYRASKGRFPVKSVTFIYKERS